MFLDVFLTDKNTNKKRKTMKIEKKGEINLLINNYFANKSKLQRKYIVQHEYKSDVVRALVCVNMKECERGGGGNSLLGGVVGLWL